MRKLYLIVFRMICFHHNAMEHNRSSKPGFVNGEGRCPSRRRPVHSQYALINKNAFQWDAYRPLVDCTPACAVAGGAPARGGVPARRGCTCPGGYLPRYSPPPPVGRMTDTCKKHNLRKLGLRAVIK